jgi:hypothetical protein
LIRKQQCNGRSVPLAGPAADAVGTTLNCPECGSGLSSMYDLSFVNEQGLTAHLERML